MKKWKIDDARKIKKKEDAKERVEKVAKAEERKERKKVVG